MQRRKPEIEGVRQNRHLRHPAGFDHDSAKFHRQFPLVGSAFELMKKDPVAVHENQIEFPQELRRNGRFSGKIRHRGFRAEKNLDPVCRQCGGMIFFQQFFRLGIAESVIGEDHPRDPVGFRGIKHGTQIIAPIGKAGVSVKIKSVDIGHISTSVPSCANATLFLYGMKISFRSFSGEISSLG
ncbi:hypothetical protein SDC9_193866 [bioreactor metagenome]|uniref:Uncharacterized protein n=1 Tax=bioreactor metagenome TaxID=1076179 RepID=A0A645I4Q7_9ZZZZ